MEKLIITSCICGAEVTKEHNPAVPYTAEETIQEAKSAYDAGASIIHLHVRWDDGTPTQDKARFQAVADGIREACPGIILQVSTGGAVGMSDFERLQSTEILPVPEMASLDCGTLNFGGNDIFINTDDTIDHFGDVLKERGIKPECEVFDKGMIDLALKSAAKGHIDSPMHFNFVLGVQMAATIRDLVFMATSIPAGSTWTATGIGKGCWDIAAATIGMGGHVRVGFEDNVYMAKGVLAKSNGQMVERVVQLAGLMNRGIASPEEARRILGLAG